MTDEGIYNGWGYYREIKKYRIREQEQKISLYITQTLFTGSAGSGLSRTTLWNDFYYNEKDKSSIFRVLFQWEKK